MEDGVGPVFRRGFHTEDLHLILEDLELFLLFAQVLARGLDHGHVLVALVLHLAAALDFQEGGAGRWRKAD